jgi:hypothetical protein
MKYNKALKVAASPLDVSNRRMLRILRAACSRPLALRYAKYNHARSNTTTLEKKCHFKHQ